MLTLVLGGARSGKSRYAQSLCAGRDEVVVVATASVGDDEEMRARVERHRAERSPDWVTIEAPVELSGAVRRMGSSASIVVIDCATLWISNLLHRLHQEGVLDPIERESRVLDEVRALLEACRGRDVVIVTNEVGGGLVPETAVGREFRDLQGRANQILASGASKVVLLTAGIPLPLKG